MPFRRSPVRILILNRMAVVQSNRENWSFGMMTTGAPPASPLPGELPRSLAPFVGRRTDLDFVLNLFQDPSVRLVTILGAGGIGKTRFALELAGVLHPRFQHGAIFVPLAQLSTADELLPALAGALEIQVAPGGNLQEVVLDHLAGRQVLLLLDNFEHLLEEAPLIHDILVAGPQVKVLATSREKLNLECEILYHLRGLELPSRDSPKKVEEFDAVRLFLQKARQARPTFSLNAENAPEVVHICQLVDGLPLGILLAAAWMEHFSPAEIAGQISSDLNFLTRELQDVPSRHRGIQAVFESSYNRLDVQQKAVFRKLAVFRGGFRLAAAEAVADANLKSLMTLADKSLLWRDPNSSRYDMHELLLQYAGEELSAAGEREAILASHAHYYVDFVRRQQAPLIGPSQAAALDEIQAELDNIRQAWGWIVERRDFPAVWSILPSLYAFCDMRSRFYEGEALFRLATQGLSPRAGEAPQPAWALALLSWFDMHNYIEQLESYEEIASQARCCLEQAKLVHDPEGTAVSLVLMGTIAEHRGDTKTAILQYEAGMQSDPFLDDFYWVTMRIGLCHLDAREYPQAIQAFQTGLQRGEKTGERVKMGWSLQNIGDTLLLQGNPEEAKVYLGQARALFEKVGTSVGILWSNHSLSRAALALGERRRSRELAEAAQKIARQIHSTNWIRKVDDLLEQIDPQPKGAVAASGNPDVEPFSQRELEVLQLLKSDMSGPEIARALVISLNTVRYHTKNIYKNSRSTAVWRPSAGRRNSECNRPFQFQTWLFHPWRRNYHVFICELPHRVGTTYSVPAYAWDNHEDLSRMAHEYPTIPRRIQTRPSLRKNTADG
jgi:predicted ATPase